MQQSTVVGRRSVETDRSDQFVYILQGELPGGSTCCCCCCSWVLEWHNWNQLWVGHLLLPMGRSCYGIVLCVWLDMSCRDSGTCAHPRCVGSILLRSWVCGVTYCHSRNEHFMVMCVVVPPWDNLDYVVCSWCTQHYPTQCGMNSISLSTSASCVWWHMAGMWNILILVGKDVGLVWFPTMWRTQCWKPRIKWLCQ